MRIITLRMKLNEIKTFHCSPPILDVKEIQLLQCYIRYGGIFFLFCDAVDSNYSLSNIESETIRPTKLLTAFPFQSYTSQPIHNMKEISNFTLCIKDDQMKTPSSDQEIYLILKIQ